MCPSGACSQIRCRINAALVDLPVPVEPSSADKAGAVLALVGVVNVPVIYFSVKWWNTLHQGASISMAKAPSMAHTMLLGMLLMALSFWMYSIAVALVRARAIMLERERNSEWVKHAVE